MRSKIEEKSGKDLSSSKNEIKTVKDFPQYLINIEDIYLLFLKLMTLASGSVKFDYLR